MENRFYAMYLNTKVILVFMNEWERDDYVLMEQLVHPECIAVEYDDVKDLIAGKTPVYDKGFGCDVILAA